MAEKAPRIEMERVMDLPPSERDPSCSQPHGRIPKMGHPADEQEMKCPAFFSFVRI